MSYIGVQPKTRKNGSRVLIASLEADGDSSLTFVDGTNDVVMDSTYDAYEWHFINMHPATDNVTFGFQVNATDDAGGGYDTSQISSSYFRAKHNEDGSATALGYITAFDQANGTGYQELPNEVGNDNDQSTSGILTLYDPSSTTYVKHFIARCNDALSSNITMDCYVTGYINDTTAIDEISFKFSSGNIDAGEIHMYGVNHA